MSRFIVLLLVGCTGPESALDETNSVDGGGVDTDSDGFVGLNPDPFAPRPDTREGLVNVSLDLERVLEGGALEGACGAWEADPEDRRKELMCGKYMFFYEDYEGVGLPAVLSDYLASEYPHVLGEAYSELGMIPDPFSEEGRPIGLAPGKLAGTRGDIETLAFTCASCHFGQLPDGRYAVGMPNLAYDYGTQNLAWMLAPSAVMPDWDDADHDDAALVAIDPLLEAIDERPGGALGLMLAMAPLASFVDPDDPIGVSKEAEGYYASWRPGVLDSLIDPIIEDNVHVVTRMQPLWGIPTNDEVEAAEMESAMLAWGGVSPSLDAFLLGFVTFSEGDLNTFTPERLNPLKAYLESLQAPVNPDMPDSADIVAGEQVFVDAGCAECHGGPQGSGLRIYDFDEIGTDVALEQFGDPDLDGEMCCGLEGVPTHGVKSPRLVGVWAFDALLHNGSVGSLEELLCVDGPRDVVAQFALGNGGHEFGCDLDVSDKHRLIDYLNAH